MTKLRCRRTGLPVVLAALLVSGACSKDRGDEASNSRPIKEIMNKLTKGPQSPNTLLGQELQADSPDWGTIQSQTKEFAELTASLGQYTPPKGSQESWASLTKAYADSAAALHKAAQAKDKAAAQTAHNKRAASAAGRIGKKRARHLSRSLGESWIFRGLGNHCFICRRPRPEACLPPTPPLLWCPGRRQYRW